MEETIQIFIPDASYDNEELSAQDFKARLINQLKEVESSSTNIKLKPLLQANIGAGADWPALLAEIIPLAPYASGLVLFFSGKKINENLDAWTSIGQKIFNLSKLTGGWLNRGGALIVSLFKIQEELGKITAIEILQYETKDGRFESDLNNLYFTKNANISDDLSNEFKGGQIHYFRIKANNSEFEIIIRSSEIIIIKGSNDEN
jgi:hypothetical protein